MLQLKHIWLIALKDLKVFASDRVALFFYILFPFIFIVLFNFMLRDVGGGDARLELHMVTREAAGSLSYQIIDALVTKDPSQLAPGQPEIIWDKDYKQALQDVNDQKLGGFLAFPADFTQGVMMGYGTQIEVVVDPAQTSLQAALGGLASSIASQVGARQVATNAAVSLIVEGQIASGNVTNLGPLIMTLFTSPQPAVPALIMTTIEDVGAVKPFNPAQYVIPGYLVMFTFFAAAQSASVIVRERQNNTLERLLSTSARQETILAGMFTGTVVRGLVQIAIFWGVGIVAFQIDMGPSPTAVVLLSFLMVIMSAAFAIMLATFTRTERGAGSLGVLVSLVLAPLGGCWWPLFIEPKWMQFIAKITPHGWANTGFNNLMLFGGNFGSAVPDMLVLVGFGIVFGTIAVMRFRTSAT